MVQKSRQTREWTPPCQILASPVSWFLLEEVKGAVHGWNTSPTPALQQHQHLSAHTHTQKKEILIYMDKLQPLKFSYVACNMDLIVFAVEFLLKSLHQTLQTEKVPTLFTVTRINSRF